MTAAPLLHVDRLCAGYGRAQILYDVSLEVRAGEVVALMGRTGYDQRRAEIKARRQQYEHYRDRLLSFPELKENAFAIA